MANERCESCDKELHSITTRTIGSHRFCPKCADEVIPEVERFVRLILQERRRLLDAKD